LIAIMLTLMLSLQGNPVLPQGGRVTGVLRTAEGAPASKVRVSATMSPRSSSESTAELVSLGETGEDGRFVLENIPPGRYYIVAGRVDLPTVYPGTQEIAKGTTITVTSGATVSGIDFVIAESSYRPATPERPVPRVIQATLPVNVIVEGGGKLPVSAGGRSATIQLTPVAGGKTQEVPLNSAGITLPLTPGVTEEYRVRIDNLPEGYVVKSMTFDSADLTTETLKASLSSLPSLAPPRIVTFGGEGELQRKVDQAMQRAAAARRGLSIMLALDPRTQPDK
jgi:hypothetical protein